MTVLQECLNRADPFQQQCINPLNNELNPICYLLALLGAHHFLHVSRIRVKSLILRLLMLYIYDISSLRVNTSAHCSGHKQVKGEVCDLLITILKRVLRDGMFDTPVANI